MLIAALFLTSPAPQPHAAPCVWWSRAEQRCRDEDVEILGPWDPRPGPGDWPSTYYTPPAAWGAYPLEQSRGQTFTPGYP
jgi:hypothetical protein